MSQFNFQVEPFEYQSQLDGKWQSEINRNTHDYNRWLQRALNQVLGLRLVEDGIIGTQTRSAIRSFQQRAGLLADGIAGARTEAALIAAGAPKPGSVIQVPTVSTASSIPTLLKREPSPPTSTLYVEIDLRITDSFGKRVAPMTGIFIPAHFSPQASVDLILYLHGFKTRPPDLTIDGYWNRQQSAHWPLREGVNDSQRNVILVAPTLGPRSQTGRLTQAGGLDAYLDQVLSALTAYGPHRTKPRVANIILACHSGGGYPMRRLATGNDRYATLIRECWGFDCTYNTGDDTLWAQWARSHPQSRLYIYYLANTRTERLSLSLKRKNVPNVFVKASSANGHNLVPIAHWRERIQSAPFLP